MAYMLFPGCVNPNSASPMGFAICNYWEFAHAPGRAILVVLPLMGHVGPYGPSWATWATWAHMGHHGPMGPMRRMAQMGPFGPMGHMGQDGIVNLYGPYEYLRLKHMRVWFVYCVCMSWLCAYNNVGKQMQTRTQRHSM
jgi:hypothetical protein